MAEVEAEVGIGGEAAAFASSDFENLMPRREGHRT